jgi:hypothetical protein
MMEKTLSFGDRAAVPAIGQGTWLWVKTAPDVRRRLLHYERAWNKG